MLKKPLSGNRQGRKVLLSLAGIVAFLGLTFLVSFHAHHDFKSHDDCAICLSQASFFSLTPTGMALTSVAAVAFLALFQSGFSPSTQLIRLVSIRAPPESLT